MNQDSIRPKELVSQSKQLELKEIKKLLVKRDQFVEVACPACQKNKSRLKFTKEGFAFRECLNCEMLYVSPRPSAQMLNEYYSTSEAATFFRREICGKTENIRKQQIFRPRVELVLKLTENQPIRRLVDVGAGNGWFTSMCEEMSIAEKVVAIEPNPESAEWCKRNPAVEVLESPIEDVYESLNADVITNFELIEHLFDPSDFLDKCRRGLSDNGIFICTTPNWHGFDMSFLLEASDNIHAPNHLNYYTPQSLSLALRTAGFSEIEIITPGKLDVDIVNNKLLSNEIAREDYPFWGRVISGASESFMQDLQELLVRYNLSSHMMARAR